MSIKSTILGLAAVSFIALPMSALAKGHDEPGTPGEPNCHGQTMAYLNELGATADPPVRGIGNIAKAFGISVAELQALVDEACTPDDDGEGDG
jgi:hypothetical protein